ncbi:MAG: hypothetical protein ACREQ5_39230 [Candidatus Dormibacteria bacterium]
MRERLAQMALTDTKLAAGPSADASANRTMPPAGATNFEQSFDLAERQFADALKAVKTLKATVTSAHGAAVTGDIAQLEKSLHAAKVAAEQVGATLSSAGGVLDVDFREGSLLKEVLQTATAARLRGVRMMPGTVISFPVIVAPEPEKLSIRFCKKLRRALRPSVIVRELEHLRVLSRRHAGLRERRCRGVACSKLALLSREKV